MASTSTFSKLFLFCFDRSAGIKDFRRETPEVGPWQRPYIGFRNIGIRRTGGDADVWFSAAASGKLRGRCQDRSKPGRGTYRIRRYGVRLQLTTAPNLSHTVQRRRWQMAHPRYGVTISSTTAFPATCYKVYICLGLGLYTVRPGKLPHDLRLFVSNPPASSDK